MGAKRNPQPAAVPASTVNSSLKPSTAASSQSSTQSPLRSGANKPSGSSATTTSSTTSSSTTNQRTTPATPSNAASASLKTAQANAPAPVTGKKTRGNTSSNTGAIYSLGEAQEVLQSIWTQYVRDTPQRVKLVDTFMAFLVLLGAVQFAYCVLAGNYPFNAFLSGFSATVGQFVLTASLRMQTNPANKAELPADFSDERAFADYVFGSLILHFFCVNFIN